MWKKLKRWSAMLLAAFLVIGSVEYTGLVAEAEGTTGPTKEITVALADLGTPGGYGYTVNGETISLSGQYQEIQYAVPSSVDASKLVEVKVNVTSSNAADLTYKLLDSAGTAIFTGKGTERVLTPSGGTPATVGIMASSGQVDITVTGITFVVLNDGYEIKETTKNFTDWEVAGNNNVTVNSVTEGTMNVTFGSQWNEIQYAIPEDVDGANLLGVTIGVSSTDATKLSCRLYDASGTQTSVTYGGTANVLAIKDYSVVAKVGIALYDSASATMDVTGITFRHIAATSSSGEGSGTEGGGTGSDTYTPVDGAYTFADMPYKASANGEYSPAVDEDGRMSVSFTQKYGQVAFSIPSDIDASLIEKVVFNGVSGSSYAFKLLNEEGLASFDKLVETYGNTTLTTGALTDEQKASIKYIVVMTTASASADAPVEIKVDSVSFTLADPSKGSSTSKYYTFKDVTEAGGYQNTTSVSDYGVLSISYDQQYAEKMYTLPAGVDVTTLSRIELDVSDGTASKIALKLYVDGAEKHAQVNYNSYIDVTTDLSSATSVVLGVMNNDSGAASYVIDNIKITAVQTGGSDTEPETGRTEEEDKEDQGSTDVIGELVVTNGSMQECTVDATGATFSFNNKNYESLNITLPGAVTTANLESITFDIEAISGGENIMFALKDLTGDTVKYGNTSTFVYEKPSTGWGSASISKLAIMTHGKDVDGYFGKEGTVKFKGVTFTYSDGTVLTLNKFEIPKPTSVLSYHFGDLSTAGFRNGSCEVDSRGRGTMTFGGSSWGYYSIAVPEEIAGMKILNVKVFAKEIVDGREELIAAKFYDDMDANCDSMETHYEVAWNGGVISSTGHNFADTDKVLKKICFAGGTQENIKIIVSKIQFTVEGEVTGGSDFVSDMEYHFNPGKAGLTKKDGWDSTVSYLSSGRLTFNSDVQYGETRFVYPAELSGAILKNVALDVSIGSVENLTVKLYTATDETGEGIINGLKAVQTVTGQSGFAVTTSEPIAAIGFMNNATANMDITIDKVTFTVDGDVDGGSTFEKVVNETVPVASIDPIVEAGVTVIKSDAADDNKVIVNFEAQNKTAYFAIPSYVDMSKIKYFLLDNLLSDFNPLADAVGTPLNGVQLAGYTEADFASGTPTIISDTSALITNGRTDIKYFGLRSTAPTAGVSFDSIVFIKKNVTPDGDYKTWKADAFNGLAHANSTAAIEFDGVDRMTLTFNNPGDEAILRLPEGLNLANVDLFTFAFAANDVALNLNLYDADLNLVCGSGKKPFMKDNYWVLDRTMMGDAAHTPVLYIGISAATADPAGATCMFDGVSVNEFITPVYDGNFVVPTYTTITYTWEDIMKMEGDGWSGATYERVSDGILINYGKNYGEVALKLPAMIDLAQCETITVKLNGQTVPVAVKVKKNGDTYITNYDKIYGSRTFQPYTDAQVNKISLMTMGDAEGSYAKFESITFVMHGEYVPTVLGGDGIVINGDFLDPDVSDWKEACWDTATITAETSATPIYDNVTTYGNYANRTSPYQGFAQDLTGRVEQNETYKFSFWAKLSDDYKGAPDVQRVISFSPYTVDKDGVADYNPNLQGTYAQVCEVGEWTYYEGTWKVTNANEIESVYIRIIEQGTNYGQGDCVLGDYAVTGVNIEVYVPEPPSIDEDVPNLKDELTADFGDDFIVGTAIAGNEFDDIGVEMLANKHFNAITLGNELKPDALMSYSETHTPLTTATINGQTIDVPTLRFGNADARLDQILEWNEDHPDDPIKVRGHVLVWHSQTMEWFFREGYEIKQDADGNENYVTPEVMNLRLEWYIKTVLEHYVGDDSKYKDLFYGWDVVNEAVGDGTGRYRTNTVVKTELPSDTRHGSNSSWWAVYQSNEFIINAFKYANKYAPADVELYYNDYNECDTKKVQGICKLLSDVLAEEGTRIDAMGMQAHYNIFNPGMGTFEKAIRSYCAVVGKVQITELDLKASGDIGTESSLQTEYEKQAEHYNKIYNVLRKLDAEEGIEIGGVTFWGTIDPYSWLQSSSNVGGGADGSMKHCPLLFDGNYKIKPAYWAWVDYSQVDPEYVQEEYDGSTKPATPAEDEKAEDQTGDKSEASSDSAESIEETTTVTVTVTTDDKKEGGSNVAPIAAGVAAAVVVVGAGAGAVLLKKKKGLPKKDK